MAGFRRPEVPRQQIVLWSQRLDDALPQDHPARLLDALFTSAALAPLFAAWEREYHLGTGQPPYHPRDLAALYCYGMIHRIRSSRQLEQACHNRIDVIWLMSGQKPDHSTIADFVTAHKDHVKDLMRRVVEIGIRAGLIKLEHASIDSTSIEADAGRGSMHSERSLREFLERVDRIVGDIEQEYHDNESREGLWEVAPPSANDDDDDHDRLRKRRQAALDALAAIERRRREQPPGKAPLSPVASTTDPDSRVMKDKEGRRKPNYNAQFAVDSACGMFLAVHVSDAPNDLGQLIPMLDRTEANCGRLPAEISADTGYNTGRQLAMLAQRPVAGYVEDLWGAARTPAQREALAALEEGESLSLPQIEALPRGKGRGGRSGSFDRCCFIYDAAADTYRCPAGQILTPRRRDWQWDRDGKIRRMRYGTNACADCSLASHCCGRAGGNRSLSRNEFEGYREQMRERMRSAESQARYQLRRQTVEPRIGTIKTVMQLRKFLRRGKEKVNLELQWTCIAFNLKVLISRWDASRPALE